MSKKVLKTYKTWSEFSISCLYPLKKVKEKPILFPTYFSIFTVSFIKFMKKPFFMTNHSIRKSFIQNGFGSVSNNAIQIK